MSRKAKSPKRRAAACTMVRWRSRGAHGCAGSKAGFQLPVIVVALACAACDEPARPWDGVPTSRVRDESTAFLPTQAPLPKLSEDLGDGGTEPEPAAPPPKSYGGLWVSCYEKFAPSGVPLRDVTRLGLMCGPANGMTRVGQTHSGTLEMGSAARHRFGVEKNDCFRVFAVAGGAIEDLDVRVLSSRQSKLTADDSDHNWPIVDRARPFCSFDDDTFTVELTGDGAGPYALEVWRLMGYR